MIWEKKETEEIEEKLGRVIVTKAEQEIQQDREKIERSSYWKYYKEWTPEINGGKYWKDSGTDGRVKEAWAKLRVGNCTKEGEKGFKNKSLRVCQEKEETLGLVWACEETKKRTGQGNRE